MNALCGERIKRCVSDECGAVKHCVAATTQRQSVESVAGPSAKGFAAVAAAGRRRQGRQRCSGMAARLRGAAATDCRQQ